MIDKTITFDRFVRWLLVALLVAIILFTVNYLSSVLLPFFVAWLLSYLLYPLVKIYQYKLHFKSRALSIVLAFITVVAVISGILYVIVPQMIDQIDRLANLLTAYVQKTTHIKSIPYTIETWIAENSSEIEKVVRSKDFSTAVQKTMPHFFNMLSQTTHIIISAIASMITLIYTFFILLDYEELANGFIKIFPKKTRPFWRSLINDMIHQLNCYVRGQGLVALFIGILFCIGFTIIDFPMAIGMGILIGIMSLIPYVHSLALIPILFLSVLKAVDNDQNFWIVFGSAMGVFLIVQLITDMILTPRIMGKAMGLNPAILLLSLSVWGTLLGFIGVIIALPLTTIIMIYYQRYVTKEHENEVLDNENTSVVNKIEEINQEKQVKD